MIIVLASLVFLFTLFILTKPVGLYLERVFSGKDTWLKIILGPMEKIIYRLARINPDDEQHWTTYATHLLTFSATSLFITYILLRCQGDLPLNPQHFPNLRPDLAFNTAMSFVTNTNWQSYSGEQTMSYFSQAATLTLQNFLSASIGLSVAIALLRALSRKQEKSIGNFWADMVRGNLYVLLPLSLVLAFFLVSQGTIQNFSEPIHLMTVEGQTQILAQGPVASQTAIKVLGTNGGGFFNSNSAHPFENPTPFSNVLQVLAMLLLPSALIYLLGRSTNHHKHAWSVWASVLFLFILSTAFICYFEHQGSPLYKEIGATTSLNMEGKETRFGIFDSALFASATTSAASGATNSALASYAPISKLVFLINMLTGEVIFGGVGSGLYMILMYVILTVFITGLMVGRSPEYLGKRIEGREVKYIMLALIISALTTFIFTAWAVMDPRATSTTSISGPHGFSEILYAYASATNNNGSALNGLTANTPFWNYTLAIAMFLGRYFVMITALALAGSFTKKSVHPGGEGSLPVAGVFFTILLTMMILLIGALTYFPVLTLGPIVEHFNMMM